MKTRIRLLALLFIGSITAWFYFHPTQYRYQAAATAIFQNEERFLKEWLDYHRAIGVEHFYLFNNLSSDGYLAVLEPYIDRGEVELIDWPYKSPEGDERAWTRIQSAAYRKALDKARYQAKWLAIIDTDEFIVPMQKDNLADFLKEYEGFGGVLINWQVFGTSHIDRIPSDRLMIETLLLKSPDSHEMNTYCKSIVRPEKVLTCHDPHHMVYYPWILAVGPDKKTFNWKFHKGRTPVVDRIRINHYWSRDEEFFVHDKLARYRRWGVDPTACIQRNADANQIKDTAILRFIPKVTQN